MPSYLVLSGLITIAVTSVVDDQPTYKGRSIQDWIRQLKSESSADRSAAVRDFGPDAIVCVPALINSLENESLEWRENSCNPERRRWLAGAFSRIGAEAVPALRRALKDPRPGVRGWSAFILATMRHEPRQTAEELLDLVKDTDPGVRKLAIIALSRLRPEAWMATPALIEALRDDDANVRLHVVASLKCAPGDLLPIMAIPLIDPSPKVRQSAVLSLSRFGPDAVRYLIRAMQDDDSIVRQVAARELAAVGPAAQDAAAVLIHALRRIDPVADEDPN